MARNGIAIPVLMFTANVYLSPQLLLFHVKYAQLSLFVSGIPGSAERGVIGLLIVNPSATWRHQASRTGTTACYPVSELL